MDLTGRTRRRRAHAAGGDLSGGARSGTSTRRARSVRRCRGSGSGGTGRRGSVGGGPGTACGPRAGAGPGGLGLPGADRIGRFSRSRPPAQRTGVPRSYQRLPGGGTDLDRVAEAGAMTGSAERPHDHRTPDPPRPEPRSAPPMGQVGTRRVTCRVAQACAAGAGIGGRPDVTADHAVPQGIRIGCGAAVGAHGIGCPPQAGCGRLAEAGCRRRAGLSARGARPRARPGSITAERRRRGPLASSGICRA